MNSNTSRVRRKQRLRSFRHREFCLLSVSPGSRERVTENELSRLKLNEPKYRPKFNIGDVYRCHLCRVVCSQPAFYCVYKNELPVRGTILTSRIPLSILSILANSLRRKYHSRVKLAVPAVVSTAEATATRRSLLEARGSGEEWVVCPHSRNDRSVGGVLGGIQKTSWRERTGRDTLGDRL